MTFDQIHALAVAEKAGVSNMAPGMDVADATAVGVKVREHYELRISALRDALVNTCLANGINTDVEPCPWSCPHWGCAVQRALRADDEASK